MLHLFPGPFRGPCHGRLDNRKLFPRCQESKQKREGFFGGVGMARHSQNDWTVHLFRANVIEPSVQHFFLCFWQETSEKKNFTNHAKVTTPQDLDIQDALQHTTAIFINVFTIALHCNHQLASSACLCRSTSSSTFAPSV